MKIVIDSSIEILDQMSGFIGDLDDISYTAISKPLFNSSIGEHLRHIIDFYRALMTENNNINYDIRRRGAATEHLRQEGLAELAEIRLWLQTLDQNPLDEIITVTTEVSVSMQTSVEFKSSFKRELNMASTHLLHHLALMAMIAKTLHIDINPSIGIAPATVTYLRKQAN